MLSGEDTIKKKVIGMDPKSGSRNRQRKNWKIFNVKYQPNFIFAHNCLIFQTLFVNMPSLVHCMFPPLSDIN